jgi:predicted nucleic acid-binding Zn ribbon protein
MKKATRAGSVLKQLMQQPGMGEQLSRHQAWLIWDQLVGEQIAARARPRKLRQGVLEVAVDHPVWMQQLHMLKPTILEKINARIPNAGITDIYLRQGKPNEQIGPRRRQAYKPPPWRDNELSPAERAEIEGQLEVLADEELKQEMRELFGRQKQLDKNRSS